MTTPVNGLPFGSPELEADVGAGLVAVEAMLREAVKSDYPFVTETSRHLVEAGGKRFRPLLVLLAAQFADPGAQGVVPAAVVVELTHLATLYHDDVMDEAELRRGAVSANSRWGNTVAILTGDFLFAKASDLLADLGTECVRIQARTFERLVAGQIRETTGPEDGTDAVEHHLRVIREPVLSLSTRRWCSTASVHHLRVLSDKTGSLIGTSCRFGAMLSGADEATTEVLTRYGERIGVAFQLSDDLLDVASTSAQSGKTPGTDLREGIATLPVLYAQRDGSAELRAALAADLGGDAALARALDLLRSSAAMRDARALLAHWADDARQTLDPLPAGAAKEALQALCDYVVARTS